MAVFVALTLAVSLVIALTIASRLLVICAPRELLLIMGRRTAETTRYSVLRNGRVLRIPGFQRVFRLPLGVFEVPFSVHSCDQHHVPVALSGVAALRIGGDDASIARAATRLLGLDQADRLLRVPAVHEHEFPAAGEDRQHGGVAARGVE